MRATAKEKLAELGLLTIQNIDQAVETLSGGQRQGWPWCARSRSGSKVVIMDEPTAALGVREGRRVLELIRGVKERGMPIVLISHNMPHCVRGRGPDPRAPARETDRGAGPEGRRHVRCGRDHDRGDGPARSRLMYLVGGEVLFDCFIDEGAGPDQAHIHAVAGGSPFNVARGIARLGGKAAFLGGVSTSPLGRKIRRLLESEGVDAQYVIESEAPTPLSVVGTGPDGSPSYVFYNRGTAECSLTPRSIPRSTNASPDSISARTRWWRSRSPALWPRWRRPGATASSPWTRTCVPPSSRRCQVWRRRVEAMVAFANLVRVSREDLDHLYPSEAVDGIAQRWLDTAPIS